MSLDKIIVGVDLSPESEIAVEHALAIARRTGAELVLVHARTVIETSQESGGVAGRYTGLAEAHQKHVREQLGALRERHSGQGVDISQSLVDGFADTALEEVAAELGAGLIAVGTHGRTGVKRFLLGSVAEKVARISARDVLVARPGHSRGGYARILVPTDFSSLAENALVRAIELAGDGAVVDLFHCRVHPVPLSPTYYPVGDVGQLDEDLAEAAQLSADALIARHQRDGMSLRYDSVPGQPGEAIIERAAGYDLVAVGSHGRRGVRRMLLGSVAEATVRHAPCSVLVAHAAQER